MTQKIKEEIDYDKQWCLTEILNDVLDAIREEGFSVYKVPSIDLYVIVNSLVHNGYFVTIAVTNDGYNNALITVKKQP